jgi:tungstate transport system ATP-binding protein
MAEPAILPLEARGVAVRFGDFRALEGIDLAIDGRRRVAILGANGAGKSVLLRTLHGLIEPQAGSILWNGSARRPREQAMVFQHPVMLRRGAAANVEYALAVNGVQRVERVRRTREVLERSGLAHLAQRNARVLSGGEQQRIALARAWALRPRLIFLDEPTASLDPAAAAEVERMMEEIHAAGTAIVFSTHVLGFARRVADDIFFLHQGRLVERTPADAFFTRPHTPEAAQFLRGELP